jgi:hypothetical protein
VAAEDQTSEDQKPNTGAGHGREKPTKNPRSSSVNRRSSASKRPGGWGGRRPGAGAPKGNLNGFKHGRRSRRLADAVQVLVANPKVRATLEALANRAGIKHEKAEEAAIRFFLNSMTRGIKIENPEQARALANLLRKMAEE